MGKTVPFDIKKKPSQELLFSLRKTVQETLYP